MRRIISGQTVRIVGLASYWLLTVISCDGNSDGSEQSDASVHPGTGGGMSTNQAGQAGQGGASGMGGSGSPGSSGQPGGGGSGQAGNVGEGGMGGQDGEGGVGGVGGGSNIPSPFPCVSSTPLLVLGQDSGFDQCKPGFLRRRAVMECPSSLPQSAHCPFEGNCTSDADCTAAPHGYCRANTETEGAGGYFSTCSCEYGCRKDSDCGAGSICLCDEPIGRCVAASCLTDQDCAGELLCASYLSNTTCELGFACQHPQDECVVDEQCINIADQHCTYDETLRSCDFACFPF